MVASQAAHPALNISILRVFGMAVFSTSLAISRS
jgi:hypothetical protein